MDGLGQTIDRKQTMNNTLQYKLTLDQRVFCAVNIGFFFHSAEYLEFIRVQMQSI